MDLYIILACHNRRASTLQCIQSAYDSAKAADLEISITLYDDGSTDETAAIVAARFPEARILTGTGSDYWAKSMASAESDVVNRIRLEGKANPCIVWLNDDVILDTDALERLCLTAADTQGSIVVGAMRDPQSGAITYSGLKRQGLHPLSFKLCPSTSIPQKVETFNGNLVLVPFHVAETIGGIDGEYSHALADIDYGLRAKAKSVETTLAPGSFGTCARNVTPAPQDIGSDWKRFIGPKGAGNPGSMRRILKRTSPKVWPIYYLASYALWWGRRMLHETKIAQAKPSS